VTVKEVLKQSDEVSLRHTAKIIDELSKGIIICNEQEHFSLELYNFFDDILGIKTDEILRENFWRKGITDIYGTHNKNFTNKGNLTIEKEYFNKIYEYKLLDYIDIVGVKNFKLYRDSKVDTKWYDNNKQKNINEHKTFKQLYMAEIGGAIDFYRKDIEDIFYTVVKTKAKIEQITSDNIDPSISPNIIYNIFD